MSKKAAKKKGPSKAELEAQLKAINEGLMVTLFTKERQLIYQQEKTFEAIREQRILEHKLQCLKEDLREKERWRKGAAEELERQLKELQQQEATESKLLQQQLQQQQQMQQQLVLQQRHITKQIDNEVADTEQTMKERHASAARMQEEFISMSRAAAAALQQQLQQPLVSLPQLLKDYEEQIQTIYNQTLAETQQNINAQNPKHTLGAGWRGLGIEPPSAVTKLVLN